jgi:hypothetical protein
MKLNRVGRTLFGILGEGRSLGGWKGGFDSENQMRRGRPGKREVKFLGLGRKVMFGSSWGDGTGIWD